MIAEQALRNCSDAFLNDAANLDGAGATSCAYNAGYFALMSALSQDERRQFQDHPVTRAALIGALKLRLSVADRKFACRMARHYYSPNRNDLAKQADCLAWAVRVRQAAGWTASTAPSTS